MKKYLVISFLFAYPAVNAQQVEQTIKKGNDLYRQQQYEPAAAAYDEALAKDPANKTAMFNRASTVYRLSKYSEAIKSFDDLAAKSTETGEKAKSYYNKGAILSHQNGWKKVLKHIKTHYGRIPMIKKPGKISKRLYSN
ncbi:MAG: tetratricopeptide repeat protein [Bacteroidota bacterium]